MNEHTRSAAACVPSRSRAARLGLGVAVFVALSAAARGQERERRPPNVVLIVADDLGVMDVGFNNPDCFYDTPNLDRLAATGMRFTDAYAANPVCSPTRFSLMTGKYPTRRAATNWFGGHVAHRFRPAAFEECLPLDETTLAEALRARGYRTFFAGKWHLGPDAEHWPEAHGYEINKGGWTSGSPRGGYFAPWQNPRLESGPAGEYLPERLAAETAAFIAAHADRSFFVTLCFYTPHTPYQAPAALIEKYRERAAERGYDELTWEQQSKAIAYHHVKRRRGRERTLQAKPVYAAMVESLDAAIGTVLDQLETSGLVDDTLVVFSSDNGGLSTAEGHATSNAPFRRGKGWVYEGGIREPFVIRLPGVTEPGSSCSVPVISTDVYPTILAAVGAPLLPEQHVDGESLLPLLDGSGALDRDALFWHYPHYSQKGAFPGGAIRVGDWKLVENYEDGRVELFHLAEDVGEADDRAAAEPERAAALRGRLHAWYRELDARFLRARDGGPEPWRPGR